MKTASAFFIARPVKALPLPESISSLNATVGKRRKSMISQGYTLCEVNKGKSHPAARRLAGHAIHKTLCL